MPYAVGCAASVNAYTENEVAFLVVGVDGLSEIEIASYNKQSCYYIATSLKAQRIWYNAQQNEQHANNAHLCENCTYGLG